MPRAKSLRTLASEAIAAHASAWMWKGLAAIIVSMVGLSFTAKIDPTFRFAAGCALAGLGLFGILMFAYGMFRRPEAPDK